MGLEGVHGMRVCGVTCQTVRPSFGSVDVIDIEYRCQNQVPIVYSWYYRNTLMRKQLGSDHTSAAVFGEFATTGGQLLV